jgi:hypothetical protein
MLISKQRRLQLMKVSMSRSRIFRKSIFVFLSLSRLQCKEKRPFCSLGGSFLYDKNLVLTDRKDNIHNYQYTLQDFAFPGIPLTIPKNLITLSGQSLFSIAVRWYWMLPGTEIYSSWATLKARHLCGAMVCE